MKYNPKEFEKKIHQKWISGKYREINKGNKSFTIIMPPPNVTGRLHLGHAWNSYYPDTLMRYKQMKGYDAIWYPGLDHAGIATQAKVEQKIWEEQGKNRFDLGRDEFLDQLWEWKEFYAKNILEQWSILGILPNLDKIKFTLDDDVHELVYKSFIELYKKGWIYKGKRLINWDTKLKTSISNLEINEEESNSWMYHIKYQIKNSNEKLIISTTRPETMFADKVAFVNPNDSRYKEYIGKYIINPANNQEMIIMADDYVEIEKGSGVMKCTPAHDFNDYELGKKYNLEFITCYNDDGTLNELGVEFEDIDRLEVRKLLIKKFEEIGIVEKEEYKVIKRISDRSGTEVEPMISTQWFLKAQELANLALKEQQSSNSVDFYPLRFNKVIEKYLEKMEDWCISRQLWWGHRIPAWYRNDEIKVQIESPGDDWIQDEDVLDTWYSSGLWPLAYANEEIINRSENNEYLSDVLFTGYDIILFWVSRMMFQSVELDGRQPFKKAIIHGLVRDSKGRKMSKSLGNGIDPMDVIEKWGTDSLRSFLLGNSTPGQDIKYNEKKINSAWDTNNKIYNAANLLIKLAENNNFERKKIDDLSLTKIDNYILTRLKSLKITIEKNIEIYNLTIIYQQIYDFIWNDLTSNYLEFIKVTNNNIQLQNAINIFIESLIILHPFIPFTTEKIYEKLTKVIDLKESILLEKYPVFENIVENIEFERNLLSLFKAARIIDSMPERRKEEIKLYIKTPYGDIKYIDEINFLLERILNAKAIVKDIDKSINIKVFPKFGIVFSQFDGINLFDTNDLLNKEREFLENELERANNLLSNKNFIMNADKRIIDNEKEKVLFYKESIKLINEN